MGDIATETTEVAVQGALTPEGDLVLDEKPDLPAGRVDVTLRVPARPSGGVGLEETLHQIHRALEASGFQARSREEVDADLRALRGEWGREERAERLGAVAGDRLRNEVGTARAEAARSCQR